MSLTIPSASHCCFTALMSLVGPHPALKASVPINPMVDVWRPFKGLVFALLVLLPPPAKRCTSSSRPGR